MSSGDLRSALNDLYILSSVKKEIKYEDLESLGYREREQNIFDSLKIMFKTKNVKTASEAFDNVNKNPEEIMMWIEQNIANEYEKNHEVKKALENISKADLFMYKMIV